MLLLVLADGNVVRLIKQDVRSHKRRISEQSEIDVFGCFLALFLELRHSACFTELSVAIEHPSKFCVLGHLRLHEQRRLLGVKSYCKEYCHKVVSATAQVRRDVVNRDCVHIRNRINALILVLKFDHVFERADIVAQLQITRRLQCAIYDFLFLFFHNTLLYSRFVTINAVLRCLRHDFPYCFWVRFATSSTVCFMSAHSMTSL